jgi:hypothetical protein
MLNQSTDARKFRGGAWDLRRIDRRRDQVTIAFPDRRKHDRRMADQGEDFSGDGMLQWVDPSDRDE